ncbi:hypothetical protein HNP81_000016 [Peribacillus huizhouensis]|uniref:Uncharacterized protein n=1 Tax=Peribacillus huizhouensis TaxID=1501239 RepID=A0ABR6CI67_9BACI|nr:hypothetical protein [Peribacillus huizhouensis]
MSHRTRCGSHASLHLAESAPVKGPAALVATLIDVIAAEFRLTTPAVAVAAPVTLISVLNELIFIQNIGKSPTTSLF